MSIDDIGARNLIAGILKKACDDYANNKGCPDWCTFRESCADNKIDFKHCDAKKFLHSAWCAALCDGLDIEHDKYIAVCIKRHRLSRNTHKYVEQEIRQYKNTLKELEYLKNEIILESPEKQEGKSSAIGNPTASKAVKVSMDKKIIELEKTQKAIEKTYRRISNDKKVVMEEYWQGRCTTAGLAYRIGVDERTIRRWKQYIVYSVAVELNYL
ncbi:hypothetical protein SOV_35880 [Sporomusa ovata DSM 2662]|uniref:Phage protein n=1 Tax=Sporomusa ovata TaxID=2378 RepID=A0A0U1L865_9FIRM|nr:phage transcriptional activator, RinA family [Sporomusa ovata]EQB24737.1 phage transcriptional activator, RinA family [Sporomusa ovata DSM 2662]CQR75084.1 hypothetical protein SpAn4DRAFT_4448 [Sporomusa ovata]